ncbi:cobyric acid synthase [Paenibacillus segetis]|uniref:Cobyric acid synthase n=1 Tax=Paenibacillus segetis TaxID=1325360 RepID=A0ABQ1Y5J6_9BACL|nr:cobyric acid synthase [Paenibacillus segetis]GGH13500.1 cobyric acid synthase [Paenibacillus segetis]
MTEKTKWMSDDDNSIELGAVLMVQGTASDVGKSVIVTALCRIFKQDGLRTAPFKSQNMALNSYVTPDGLEIGRAQGIQAEACGISATTDMNPVLIKPTGDMHSQIVVHGKPYQHLSAVSYREDFLPQAKPLVMDALKRLRENYDIIVMEGAGSPAEINLKHRDIVNMNLAGWADAPVILVADIDRGGVFAFLVGTLELLEPEEKARVKGFIINKFRGDLSLLQPGLDWLEQKTGIPVLGVLPYIPDLEIEAEDSVILDSQHLKVQAERELEIVVIRYPRISNFTDFDCLAVEGDVSLRYVDRASDLGTPDIIILPGTKDTIGDLSFLRDQGLDAAIEGVINSSSHTQLVGICGGYQMLGNWLSDPEGIESGSSKEAKGLGWLPVSTVFRSDKTTIRVHGVTVDNQPIMLYPPGKSVPVEGYEIHAGDTSWDLGSDVVHLFSITRTSGEKLFEGAGRLDGRVFGTYLHGLFSSDVWRRSWLNGVRMSKGLAPLEETFSAAVRKEAAYDRLADHVREHLNMDLVYEIAQLVR